MIWIFLCLFARSQHLTATSKTKMKKYQLLADAIQKMRLNMVVTRFSEIEKYFRT